MEKYFLNIYVKYRLEDGYILVCDCRTMRNYSFPTDFYNDFERLKKGTVVDLENGFYKDLLILKMIDKTTQGDDENELISPWSEMKYIDNEFFK